MSGARAGGCATRSAIGLAARAGLWLALLQGTGCFSLGAPGPLIEGPRTDLRPEVQAQVDRWIDALRSEDDRRRSLRGYARVKIDSEAGKVRVRDVIAVEHPARLRVETLNFLGQAQSLLVADGGQASFFDGRQIVRNERPAVLLRRLGLDLGPGEAIDLLLATPTLPAGPPEATWAVGTDRIVEFPRQRLRWSEDGALEAVEALDPRGELRWSVEFSNWSEVAGGRYPMTIRAYFPRTDLRAEFEFEDVTLNAALEAGLFQLRSSRE